MAENTTTTKELTTKPTENTFGKALENIFLLPFRAIKFAFKWSFKIVHFLFIAVTIFYLINAAFPMQVPEAQGMTTYEVLADRFDKYVLHNVDGQPLYVFVLIGLFPFFYVVSGPLEANICAGFENTKLDGFVKNNLTCYGRYYDLFAPRTRITRSTILKFIGEGMDRYTWDTWVNGLTNKGYPQPMNQ